MSTPYPFHRTKIVTACFRQLAGWMLLFTLLATVNSQAQSEMKTDTREKAQSHVRELIDRADNLAKVGENDSAFVCFLEALSYEHLLDSVSQMRYDLHMGFSRVLNIAQAHELGMRHARAALDIFIKLNGEEDPQIYWTYGHVASFYMLAEKFDSALVYFRKGLEIGRSNTRALAGAHNNMGIIHSKMGQPDSARYYFNVALRFWDAQYENREKKAVQLKYSIQDNIALLYAEAGKNDSALYLFRANELLAEKLDSTRRVQAQAGITDMLIRLNRMDEARMRLMRLKPEVNALHHYRGVEFKKQLYGLCVQFFSQVGNEKMARVNQQLLVQLMDSVQRQNQVMLGNALESVTTLKVGKLKNDLEVQQLKLFRKEERLQLAEQQASFNYLLLLSIVIVSLLLISILYLTFRKRSQEQEKQRELLEVQNQLSEAELKNKLLEGEKLRSQLDLKKKDVSDLALYLSNLRETNEQLVDRLGTIKKLDGDAQNKAIREVLTDLTGRGHVDDKTSLIQENIEQVNKEFYTKLHSVFPGLTKSENELCGLLRLNLSNKEIAALRNVSPKSVKMGRYRLRKKLGLGPEEDIYQFLDHV